MKHQGQAPFLPLARMEQQIQGQGLFLEFIGPQVHPSVTDIDLPEEFRRHLLLEGRHMVPDQLRPLLPVCSLVKEGPGGLFQQAGHPLEHLPAQGILMEELLESRHLALMHPAADKIHPVALPFLQMFEIVAGPACSLDFRPIH